MGFTQICSFFSSINLLFFVFSFCADSWAVFLERRQPVPSFKLIKLTARVTGAGEPDL
jgi:hypothetical protein